MKKLTILLFVAYLLLSFFFSTNLLNLKEQHHQIKEEESSDALEALNFWTRSRAYPNDDIPPDAYYNAYIYSKSNLTQQDKPLTYIFEQIGPHNIGGRTLDVQFNPLNTNTIFAGAASGGLWRSYTGGVGVSVWQQIPTGFPVLSLLPPF